MTGVQTVTDKDGYFKLRYDWVHRVGHENTDFILKVFDKPLASEGVDEDREIESVNFSLDHKYQPEEAGKLRKTDLGSFTVKYYESQKDMPALEIDDFANRPQQSSKEYIQKLVAAVLKGTAEAVKKLVKKNLPKEKAQEILKPSAVELEANDTLDLILNGISQAQFEKGKNEGELDYKVNWDKYKKVSPPLLPNANVTVKIADDKLQLKEITVDVEGESKVFAPGHPGFKIIGQHLGHGSLFVKGEAVDHLAKGHLMVGQLALSFYRHIKNHPIRKLLEGHFDGISEINRLGADAIFGDHGILTLSALPPAVITQLLKDTLSTMDFATFQPNELLLEKSKEALNLIKQNALPDDMVIQERFGIAKLLYWDIVKGAVDQFFVENEKAIVSEENWYELYDMSKNLVRQSLPYTFDTEDKGANFVDLSEADQPKVGGRVTHDDHWRAIRPFISSREVPKDPEVLKKEVEALKQFCSYGIFFSTFYHWAIHSSQSKWGTNVEVASLAPELIKQGDQLVGTTDNLKALKQTAIAEILVGFDAPKLVKNDYKNIYVPLIQRIEAHRENFKKLGYDIDDLHSAIWI